ncbi:MAG: EscU/YscU/HrcU family type III secretion system export apparatus switch protein [Gracilibacteraceae bacterium]|nr:EscU/YscU/HrcU family type III secretion system export apparatus switch protein [Gracilibacteraceae bacterium]
MKDNQENGKKIPEREKAAALAYNDIGVPRVIAKGEGELARKILEVADKEGVPIQKNDLLVDALLNVELSKEIPPELFEAVAEILAFIYRLNKRKGNRDQDKGA